MRRIRCSRSCLKKSLRIVNVLVNLCGVGIIIYCLWLLKQWDAGVSLLPLSSRTSLPKPWFMPFFSLTAAHNYSISSIFSSLLKQGISLSLQQWFILVCLALGIIACLSTLCGHVVVNCNNKYVLCAYAISLFSLVLLQALVIIAIFFKMDLASQLIEYIDDEHKSFRTFIVFHLYMCRVISIMALVAQTNIVLLANILWFVRTEPVRRDEILDVPDFKYSFLTIPRSAVNDDDSRTRNQYETMLPTPVESYF
ncbi:hypothetical protein Dimus_010451 [Dionaea muscipula]